MLGSIQIKLCKETYKKKRERVVEEVGKINIPTLKLDGGHITEKWLV